MIVVIIDLVFVGFPATLIIAKEVKTFYPLFYHSHERHGENFVNVTNKQVNNPLCDLSHGHFTTPPLIIQSLQSCFLPKHHRCIS